MSTTGPAPGVVRQAADLLRAAPFFVWLGRGAIGAVDEIRRLVDHTGAPVLCSARAKGIVPEDHPQFVGVTGFGGHEAPVRLTVTGEFRRALVVGSRLGEQTSGWDSMLVPPDGFVHVDIDPAAFATAFPGVPTLGVISDAATFTCESATPVAGACPAGSRPWDTAPPGRSASPRPGDGAPSASPATAPCS